LLAWFLMLISHRCRFIIFSDPLTSSTWVQQAFAPWADEGIGRRKPMSGNGFFHGMSPAEAQLAFQKRNLRFEDYTRISLVENPFRRIVHFYDRLATTDPVWRMRTALGLTVPDFQTWIENTSPDCQSALTSFGPRWRRFGAWSSTAWAAGRITHFVRSEFVHEDLPRVFARLGVTPLLTTPDQPTPIHMFREMLRYDTATTQIIRDRYSDDLKRYHSPGPQLRLVA